MARGKQYTQLLADLRAELRRNPDPGVRAADLSALQQATKRAYETLYDEYDWPHLRRTFPKVPLAAGQRYYDFPTDMDYDRLEDVKVWYGSLPFDVDRGIEIDDYASYNSEATTPVRATPVLKWDVRWVTTKEQIEVWPIPSDNNQSLQFTGIKKFVQLVDDADQCLLDDALVTLAAAIILEKDPNALKEKAGALERRLDRLKGRGKAAAVVYRMGLGQANPDIPSSRATVRIAGK